MIALALILLAASPDPTPSKIRVVIDAGHGAPGNLGNLGCYGQHEQDTTLAEAEALAAALEATGRFTVLKTRTGTDLPSYTARIAAAEEFKPEAIISLHTDARGEAVEWTPFDGGTAFLQNPDEPGFAVLWSPAGSKAAVAGRQRLGRALGAALRGKGFKAYDGINYGGLYDVDPVEPSGWVDARGPKTRVYFLHASAIPTVIVETHHALDPNEVAAWSQKQTLARFAEAVGDTLVSLHGAP